jgi:kinesin family protein 11
MQERTNALTQTLPTLAEDSSIRQPLRQLREDMSTAQIAEYAATGETPAKTQYTYPTVLPRTQDHDTLLDRMRGGPQQQGRPRSPNKRSSPSKARSSPMKGSSPSKTAVYTDHPHTINLPLPASVSAPQSRPHTAASSHPSARNAASSLRELDVNVTVTGASFPSHDKGSEADGSKLPPPKLNRHHTYNHANPLSMSQGPESKLPALRKFGAGRMTIAEGRENVAPPIVASLSASVGAGGGRVLRSRGSQD